MPWVPDPDPVKLTYPESLVVYAAVKRSVRYRERRLEDGDGNAAHEQRMLERARSALEKLDAASHHPRALARREEQSA